MGANPATNTGRLRNRVQAHLALFLPRPRYLLSVLMLSRLLDTMRAMTSVLVSFALTLRNSLRARAALQIELLSLRHQLLVLKPSRRPRVRLARLDCLLWVWLSRTWME